MSTNGTRDVQPHRGLEALEVLSGMWKGGGGAIWDVERWWRRYLGFGEVVEALSGMWRATADHDPGREPTCTPAV